MSRRQSSDPLKNTFPFPNEIFILGLCPGELAVYSYLLCCANRKTGQCWPSYKMIGKAVGMTENTVTLDVYGHVTDQMKQESARRMDSYIKDVLGQ